ncbi:hypothetical protein HMPREF1486_06242 [Streptomyces sp. HPH0547]|uniref:restriction endonuclease n=1 Tax=Streptomyces TaxID=1883 RepID=UPI00034E23B1|nr:MULTISPECIES: restriction endonuclease [Streptomyces]EPD89929.1 hypothetical protein HMPREF1486_06242 [Streptomyces sp. HPH0547]
MAARRGRGAAARRRKAARRRSAAAAIVATAVLLTALRPEVRPYLLAAALLAAAGAGGWWLWRKDRLTREQDRRWRQADRISAGRRTLAEVDAMTGTEFEELVAQLCRRDGCTEVRRVGGSHDNGADVVGRLPDGRSMVIQCKRYTPSSTIASREMRDT